MTKRQFSREFKREVVQLVTERGVSITQAARDEFHLATIVPNLKTMAMRLTKPASLVPVM